MAYNRKNTIAAFLTVLSIVIFLGGTVASAVYSFNKYGLIQGGFTLASCLALDLALFFFLYMSHHETKGAILWLAWMGKLGGMLILLVQGSLVLYLWASETKEGAKQQETTQSYQSVYKQCKEEGNKDAQCQRLASNFLHEAKDAETKIKTELNKDELEQYVKGPFFKLVPGLFAAVFAGLLSLFMVLKADEEEASEPLPLTATAGTVRTVRVSAPFQVSNSTPFPSVSNGKGQRIKFNRTRLNSVSVIYRDGRSDKYVMTCSPEEATIYCTMKYAPLVRELAAHRLASNPSDSLAATMKGSI